MSPHDNIPPVGDPVRREPLPLEFPGVHYIDNEELQAVERVLRSRSAQEFVAHA